MNERILIVEDEFIVAHDLEMILCNAGYRITGIASSVKAALEILENNTVDMVLLDIFLKGRQTGIDLAKILTYKRIPFIYISANSNEKVMEAAKSTSPYGFIVKPYRDKDVLLSIDIARYRYEHSLYLKESSKTFMEDFILDISLKPLSWESKILLISGAFQAYIPFDFLGITGITKDNVRFSEIGISRKNFSEYDIIFVDEIIKETSIKGDFIYTGDGFQILISQEPVIKMLTETYCLKSILVKLIKLDNGDMMLLSFYSKLELIFKPEHLDLLNLLETTLAKNLNHVIELEKI